MLNSVLCPWIIALLLLFPALARAEHFEIELTVKSPGDRQTNSGDTFTPQNPRGFKPVPVCHAKAGDGLTIQFFLKSNFPHDTIKGVTIRYFIIPEAPGATGPIRRPGDDAALRGEFVMDFKPNTGKVGVRQQVKIDKTGSYLVRVESDNSDSDHEHCSAISLIVE